MITIDFETHGIVGNPILNPPQPVGVAVWVDGQEPTYLSYGHPSGNNVTFAETHEYLRRIRDSGQPILVHNAGFDISVLDRYFCNARWSWLEESWRRVNDTLYLIFLADPYASTFSLKPSAERYLNLPPEEQDELHRWILANVPGATAKTAGAYIAQAPGELVAKYAIGDVVRTRKLYEVLHKEIVERGMEAAYEREKRLFPIALEATRRGIRVDRDPLEWHEQVYTQCLEIADQRLAGALNCPVEHLSDDSLLANALENSGAVTNWVKTATGKRSMAKDNIHIVRPDVKALWDYSSALQTCLSTFMRPWLEYSRDDGRLHPNWNQVRQARDDRKSKGTRTGRLSSDSPNFQNVPTEFVYPTGEPVPTPEGLHPLPFMRRYCLPEPGHVWLKRDFSSQELRILAHFEDGTMAEAYRLNPKLDVHQMAREMIHQLLGLMFERKPVKITGFSLIYGTGVTGLSIQLNTSYPLAAQLKDAYLSVFPGVRTLMDDVKNIGKSGNFIRTWGGRIYFAEPAKVIEGRLRDFSYKLLNYLIQGSAADQTKEAINDWNSVRRWHDIFLATVHDEINISAPKEEWQQSMAALKECMNRDRFDVPMLTEGFMGENWQDIEGVE